MQNSDPKHTCYIYVLYNKDDEIDYVGRTRRIAGRMSEHKETLGFKPRYEIIDRCSENCREVEKRWIIHYRESGYKLRNVGYSQGTHFATEETRRKLSASLRGQVKTEYTKEKMRAAQKGIPKQWSSRGRKRVEATQFKKGDNGWARLSPEAKERMAQAARNNWKDPIKKHRMIRTAEYVAQIWASRSNEEKAEIGRKIADSNRKSCTPERRKAISEVAKATFARPGHVRRMARASKNWWATLTPESRKEYLERRTRAIMEAKRKKKMAAQPGLFASQDT